MSDRIKLFGTDEPPAASRLMTAGPLSVEFVSGGLRAIRFKAMRSCAPLPMSCGSGLGHL